MSQERRGVRAFAPDVLRRGALDRHPAGCEDYSGAHPSGALLRLVEQASADRGQQRNRARQAAQGAAGLKGQRRERVRDAESRFADSIHSGGMRRRRLILAGVLLALFATSAATTAHAAEHLNITGEYGKEGPKATGIGTSCRMAYDSATNRLYLYSDNLIYGLERTAPGSVTPLGSPFPLPASLGKNSSCNDPDLTVNQASGNIYAVPSNESIFGWTSAGAALTAPWPVGTGGETCGVTTTNTGEVWGGNYGKHEVTKFTSAGASAGSLALGYPTCKIEVNQQNNDLFVLNYSNGELTKYTAASGYTTTLSFGNIGSGNRSLAINGKENRIYVARNTGTEIKAYDTNTAALVEEINVGATPREVVVDEPTDTLFVQIGSGDSGYIREYLGVKLPIVTTGEPTANEEVSGTVDPDGAGDVTECYFEFGTTTSYGSVQNCAESLPITSPQTVHSVLPGVAKETTYHYRLVVSRGTSETVARGADRTIIPHHVDFLRTGPATNLTRSSATLEGSFNGTGLDTHYYFEYGLTASYGSKVPIGAPPGNDAGITSGNTPISENVSGLAAVTTYHYRVVASNVNGTSLGDDRTFTTTEAIKQLNTLPATDVTPTTATFNGELDPDGLETTYYFQYGKSTAYGHNVPAAPGDPLGTITPGLVSVPGIEVSNLEPSTTYHYRIVGRNSTGTTVATDDQAFATPATPSIVSFSSKEVTATSAVLIGQINSREEDATYRFEYGPTISYGLVAPVPAGVLAPSSEAQDVEVPISGLEGVTYHFRLIAENRWGESHTEDQTFSFYPPSCPNENVRQQTQANFLPDCRAYELVSPEDAGGTLLYARGPNTGYATSPSRFSFTGVFSAIPGAGGKPIVGSGDLYVSTRTPTGWVSRYVGWPADEAAVSAGPPMGPPGSQPRLQGFSGFNGVPSISSQMPGTAGSGPRMQSGVITDLSMSRFLTFNGGNQSIGNAFNTDRFNRTPISSNAPRVYAADGSYLERWPQDLSSVPDGSYPPGVEHLYTHGGSPLPGEMPAHVAPGGERALDCPTSTYDEREEFPGSNFCPGDVTSSDDLSHFVFATRWNVFAEGGILDAPGSVYDDNTVTGTVKVASIAPEGGPIMPEPGDKAGDPLQIPAVSRNGSHILMASGGTGPCGLEVCPELPCRGTFYGEAARCPMQSSRLYMRVDGAITYDVSKGHYVEYVGTDAADTKVYYLSDEQLTPEDQDSSTDLYLWTEETDSITLVSKANVVGGPGEPGNSDDCTGGLENQQELQTTKCGVATYAQWFFCGAANEDQGGGNCLSDNSIAPDTGDIYFYSPEQLDGLRGVPDQQNLYVYHDGKVHYVTTLAGPPDCYEVGFGSFCRRMMRMQVSADGKYMAFLTASPITSYDNDGRREMYRYARDTRELVCVSCIPDGSKPGFDVAASQDGLFMSDDGRAFFTTEDALVHADTNRAQDVYEYVDGRPQLITLGTGDTRAPGGVFAKQASTGLAGVSADGTDVYFSTYDTLVRQDRNGLFLKFYDARSGGGFPAPPPAPPCEAADECHGASSQPSNAISDGTGASLGSGGNVARNKAKKKHSRHRKKRHPHKHGKKRHTQGKRAHARKMAVRAQRGTNWRAGR